MDHPLPTPPARCTRLVYLGSPELAVPPLRALIAAGFEVPLVVSRADRRRGRGAGLSPSPVKAAALDLGLDVTDDVDALLDVRADLGVVVAYGRIIKPHLLARIPFVNLHFSLLPRWRGAAPVERALLAGDERTGVCVMALEEGLDTGAVYRSAEVPIGPDDTLEGLRGRLVSLGTDLLLSCLRDGFGTPVPQRGEPVYAAKIDPAELQLAWSRPAVELVRTVRVGRAWTTFRGKRLLVHDATAEPEQFVSGSGPGAGTDRAGTEPVAGAARPLPGELSLVDGTVRVATGRGWLVLGQVQPEGRARLDATAWRNGAQPKPGEVLGS